MTNENVKCGECKKELARDDSWYWAIGDIAICEECQEKIIWYVEIVVS